MSLKINQDHARFRAIVRGRIKQEMRKYVQHGELLGKKGKDLLLFTLSTCGWCMKTKALLNELGVEYDYVDVDLLEEKEHDEVGRKFEELKTDFSFPKIIINGKVISGFNEAEIRKAVKK